MQSKPASVANLEKIALDKLPRSVRQYYEGGAEDEITLRENISSLQRYRVVPKYLIDVGPDKLDVRSRSIWGKRNVPFAVGPSAFHKLAGYDGELDVARGTNLKLKNLEDVIKAGKTAGKQSNGNPKGEAQGFELADSDWWQQLYVSNVRSDTEAFIKRSEKAGYSALLITVDRPYLGRRLTLLREKFELPPHLSRTAGKKKWLKMKLLVKGILHPEDAALAIQHGLDGVVVSNHGGRQHDAAPATIDALPAITDVIQGRIPIFFDGGVRKGIDVYRALALGADVVLLGRAILWELAAGGEEGVGTVLDIIAEEFRLVMALTGVTDITQIKRSTLGLVNPWQVGLHRLTDPVWEHERPV
ncbi:hypothetical protein IAT40_006580 [Kwoniella sp. CBS 6097]